MQLATALTTLFTELVQGPPGKECYVLNGGDVGLLGSLDALGAADASRSTQDGATIAAHVDHVRYGLSLMNRWSRGEDPFATADWTRSWRRTTVTDAEWAALRADLAREVQDWKAVLEKPRDLDGVELKGVLGSVVHLAYHLGAIRQIAKPARGPREPGA